MSEEAPPIPGYREVSWSEKRAGDAARIIYASHRTTIDSYLITELSTFEETLLYIECLEKSESTGKFHPSASFLMENEEGRAVAIVMSAALSSDLGHISQICVLPENQHRGLGAYLMRRVADRMRRSGFREVSLIVSGDNRNALTWYRRRGFREREVISAWVYTRGD